VDKNVEKYITILDIHTNYSVFEKFKKNCLLSKLKFGILIFYKKRSFLFNPWQNIFVSCYKLCKINFPLNSSMEYIQHQSKKDIFSYFKNILLSTILYLLPTVSCLGLCQAFLTFPFLWAHLFCWPFFPFTWLGIFSGGGRGLELQEYFGWPFIVVYLSFCHFYIYAYNRLQRLPAPWEMAWPGRGSWRRL